MTATPCVILYGNSVFLAGIRADLEARGQLDLVTIETGCPDAAALIRERRPAAILFDLAAAQPDFAIALLRDRPELILVGVDPSTDALLVLSGRQERPLSAGELVRLFVGTGVIKGVDAA